MSEAPHARRRVVVAGAGSALGQATVEALTSAGHEAIAVTRSVCDLSDAEAVDALAARLGAVDGLLHLVGGWRGGGGLAGQSDADWRFLDERIVGTLRHTTRAFLPAIAASPAGRIAIVSTTGLERPTASNANYLAAKAAAETWLACVGQGLRNTPASVHVERVLALVSNADREASPDKDFSRYIEVTDLASRLVGLFDDDAT